MEYIKTPFTGEWPAIMANNLRNSQSLLPGAISEPQVLTSYRYGNYRGYFLLEDAPDGAEQTIAPPAAAKAKPEDIENRYGFYGLRETVGGQLFRWSDANNGRYLHLYDDQLNYIAVTDDSAAHTNNLLRVYRVVDGTGRQELLWEAELPYYHERPHVVIADMNGDGVIDILVEGWNGMTVYDSKTHQVIMDFSIPHDSRKRGYVLLRDIKGDGFPDVVVLDIYPWDVNVVHNDGKKLSLNWFKIYDNHIESAKIITEYPRDPVNDHNGDGRMEMIFNIWNETGDGAWHIKALDAATGEELFDIPKAYLHDTVDINGDGKNEFFVSTPSGIDVPAYSEIKIIGSSGNVLFREGDAKWAVNYESYGIEHDAVHGGTMPKTGMKYLVTQAGAGGKQFFFYKEEAAGTRIYRSAVAGRDAGFSLYYPDGSDIELINSRDGRAVLAEWNSRFEAPSGAAVKGAKLTALCWGVSANQQYKIPIIANLGGASNSVVLANNIGQVVRLDYENGKLVERWAVEGFGAAEQYAANTDFGVAADDFNGDGKKEIALRVDGKQGGGIRMVDAAGKTLWQTDFPLFPSGKPSGFRGILGYYTSAKANGKTLLVVSGQRYVQHTGITYGLDGATGKILWNLDVVNKTGSHPSGAGSFYLSVFDLDDDGVDEVMTGYGNNLWAANAATGETHFEKFMTGLMEPYWIGNEGYGWLSSILPIPVRHGWPETELFFAHGGDSVGLGKVNAEEFPSVKGFVSGRALTVTWANMKRDYTNRSNQCAFDFAGRYLIAEPARTLDGKSVLRALDPITGEDIGEVYAIPENAGAVPLACDVDGDGQQEIVYTARNSVSAVRFDGTAWTQIWTLDLGEPLAWPVYGDINGDGKGEIVVTSQAGMLYVIGGI